LNNNNNNNNTIAMSLTAEQQENFEDIEKQFAVKGAQCPAIAPSMP
jgi:hypothetical protein